MLKNLYLDHKWKIICYFAKAFPFFTGLKYIILYGLRSIFDKNLKYSYSLFGEDRIIASLVDTHHIGTYVDVGCNDPIKFSNTFLFYLNGWNGVCIDGIEKCIQKWKTIRKLDHAICAVISDTENFVNFNILNDDARSFVSNNDIGGLKVKTKRLESILDSLNHPKEFDLLCIDCEGHDFEVLKSLNLMKYKPKIICIELKSEKTNMVNNEVTIYLKQYGYSYVAQAGVSSIFLNKQLDKDKHVTIN